VRTAGIVHAFVDGAAQVLQKAPKDARIYGADLELRVKCNRGCVHFPPLSFHLFLLSARLPTVVPGMVLADGQLDDPARLGRVVDGCVWAANWVVVASIPDVPIVVKEQRSIGARFDDSIDLFLAPVHRHGPKAQSNDVGCELYMRNVVGAHDRLV
jgi:hypothetical protein